MKINLLLPIGDAEVPFPTDAPSLTLRHSSQHGFYVHIGKIRRDDRLISRSPDVISIAKSKSTRAYAHKVRVCGSCVALELITSFKDWLSLGKRVVEIENNILKEERVAFERLRAEVGSGLRHLVQDLSRRTHA